MTLRRSIDRVPRDHVVSDPAGRNDPRRAKLRALILAAGGSEPDARDSTDSLQIGVDDGSHLWVLADDHAPDRALGSALLEAAGRDRVGPVVFYDDPATAAVAARRARALDPRPEIRLVDGGSSRPVEPAPVPERSVPSEPPDGFEDLCRGAGVEPLCEHGTWMGEVLGLEVVRMVGGRIEVGVGRFDREAMSLLGAGRPVAEALAAAANQVRAQRRPGAGPHPLATLARERWLRCDLVAAPSQVGATGLVPVDPADRRSGLRYPSPAPAIGPDGRGGTVLVVCTVGVDVAVVPAAADLVLREDPDRVVVVMPPRDVLGPVERAVARLALPATVVGAPGSWEMTA